MIYHCRPMYDNEDAARKRRVSEALIAWYERSHRDLPWRRARDPYAVWVSEIMLQQTRVETVIPYYARWMERFPTVDALAGAPLDAVLQCWSGLGYYSRARNLHRAAETVVTRHRGALPAEAAALRELPGIGRYTAGAIASIAFGRREPVVDGNVERVLARLFLVTDRAAAWQLAGELVPDGARASSFNQGLMELGATVCTPRGPRCLLCPLRTDCAARARGLEAELPAPRRARPLALVESAVLVLARGPQVLLARRPPRGLWGGLWEFPTVELRGGEQPGAAGRRARQALGLRGRSAEPVAVVEHILTHRRMRFHVIPGGAGRGPVQAQGLGYQASRFAPPAELATAAVSTATRRILTRVEDWRRG
jgi:A/G-specific adenine glycosylase